MPAYISAPLIFIISPVGFNAEKKNIGPKTKNNNISIKRKPIKNFFNFPIDLPTCIDFRYLES